MKWKGGGRILNSLREFALRIRASSFFPARVPRLRAGKNVTISVAPLAPLAPLAPVAPVAPVARQQIDSTPSWIRKKND